MKTRLASLFGWLSKSLSVSCLEEDNDKPSYSDPGFVFLSGSLLLPSSSFMLW